MRPCGPEPWIDGEIDAGFLGDALGERRGEDAVARRRCPAPLAAVAACAGPGEPGRPARRTYALRIARTVLACGCGAAAGAACGRGFGLRRAERRRAGPCTLFGSSPSPAISAISWLTGTSAVPSGTTILARMPSSTASTSMVALSVSISAITSPDLTVSPSFFSHLARLPFSMVGDRAGIRILMGMALMDPDRELS